MGNNLVARRSRLVGWTLEKIGGNGAVGSWPTFAKATVGWVRNPIFDADKRVF